MEAARAAAAARAAGDAARRRAARPGRRSPSWRRCWRRPTCRASSAAARSAHGRQTVPAALGEAHAVGAPSSPTAGRAGPGDHGRALAVPAADPHARRPDAGAAGGAATSSRDAGPFSLDLNVASHPVAAVPALRGGAAVAAARPGGADLLPADIVADPAAFLFARDFARARGYRLLLRGMTAELLGAFPLRRIGLDLLELRWSPVLAATRDVPLPPQTARRRAGPRRHGGGDRLGPRPGHRAVRGSGGRARRRRTGARQSGVTHSCPWRVPRRRLIRAMDVITATTLTKRYGEHAGGGRHRASSVARAARRSACSAATAPARPRPSPCCSAC